MATRSSFKNEVSGLALFLTEDQVGALITVPEVIAAVEAGLKDHGEGKASNRPRQRATLGKVVLQTMNAGVPAVGRLGFKAYTTGPDGARFWVMLFDETGALLSLMQADKLGQVRTGCASGVAAKYMARTDAHTVGMIGTGWQARTQLEAVCAVREVQEARIYSRKAENIAGFIAAMQPVLPGTRLVAAASAEAAVRGVDILITITNAVEPVVQGSWIAPGTTILAAGSNRHFAREVDTETITRCRLITADSVEQAQMESGDLIKPVAEGKLSWEDVRELSEVVAGKRAGRQSAEEINLFKSNGLALEDVVAANLVYLKAREQGVGIELPIG